MRISDMPTASALSGEEFVPIFDPQQSDSSLQNRKVAVEFFRGLRGLRGFQGLSAYQIWLNNGHSGTEAEFLAQISGSNGQNGTNGTNGMSAFQIWLENGNTGSQQDFLNSLKGKSAYQTWLDTGNTGSTADFIASIRGPQGFSPYQIWQQQGNTGSIQDYFVSITGNSAYQIWLLAGNQGSVSDFLDSLKGEDGQQGIQGIPGNQGNQGNQGPRGTLWYVGGTPPGNATGTNGDMYLNTTTQDLYGPKTSGGWGGVTTNIKGAAGTYWYTGSGAPPSGVGANGDLYLNAVNGDVYRKTTQPNWTGPVANIRGPQGDGSEIGTANYSAAGISRLASQQDMADGTAGAVVLTAENFRAYISKLELGSATAWVVFNGNSANPTIKAGFNVQSVSRASGTQRGVFDIAFTEDMDNVDYTFSGHATGSSASFGSNQPPCASVVGSAQGFGQVKTTHTARVFVQMDTDLADFSDIGVTFHGGKNSSAIVTALGLNPDPAGTQTQSADTTGQGQTLSRVFTITPSNGIGPYNYSVSQVSGSQGAFSVVRNPSGNPASGALVLTISSSSGAGTSATLSGTFDVTATDSSNPTRSATVQVSVQHEYDYTPAVSEPTATLYPNIDTKQSTVYSGNRSLQSNFIVTPGGGTPPYYYSGSFRNSPPAGITYSSARNTDGPTNGSLELLLSSHILDGYTGDCNLVYDVTITDSSEPAQSIVKSPLAMHSYPGLLSMTVTPATDTKSQNTGAAGPWTLTSDLAVAISNGIPPYSVSINQVSNVGGVTSQMLNSNGTARFQSTVYGYTNGQNKGVFNIVATDSANVPQSTSVQVTITHNYSYSTGGGGGGGCVSMGSFLTSSLIASDVKEGDILFGMNEATREFLPMAITGVRTPELQPCIRVTTAAGPSLVVSTSTPLTLEDGVITVNELRPGMRLPVMVGENTEPFWDEVVSMEGVGMVEVQLISVGGHCYAAGEKPGMYIYTHNLSTMKN